MLEQVKLLEKRLDGRNLGKLLAIANPELHAFVADFVELCNPASVFVATDDEADVAYVRRRAIELGEEHELPVAGHTYHFDAYRSETDHDQGRDTRNTRYLLPPGVDLGERVRSIDRETGVREVRGLLKDAMAGKEMVVRFFCLGPAGSEFAILCAQLTDSFYVAHSEDLLYRQGYEAFRWSDPSEHIFRFVHSAGELAGGVSAHLEDRRVYIDLEEELVYSVNTQYAGNTVGLKKLALRLAIRRASREGWLAEHMLLMGVHGPGGRVTYFTGAFPSYCGKTSTAMAPGETIVGDDLAYLRRRGGRAHAVNVESGIFGIIRDVTSKDDPYIWDALNQPGELIFTNILITPEGMPYWLGKDGPCPEGGVNHSGRWFTGKADAQGEEITPSHKNARYTIALERLANCDPRLDDVDGVPVGGFIYGGRDSDTWVPVEQAFDWVHGIVTKGASLESETTAAILGQEGVRRFDLMAILDFVAIPLGRYIQSNLEFGSGLEHPPLIFGVNYFLKGADGAYLNDPADKRVWLKWMELRVRGEADALRTPTGYIPRYESLRELFAAVLGKRYAKEDYAEQFAVRVGRHLAKIERVERVYREQVDDTPEVVFEVLAHQRERLVAAGQEHGEVVAPAAFGG
jgi:phosphoenolpyruvate carboxykinase (GTP)